MVNNNNWSQLSKLANEISTSSRLREQAIDWNILARAGRNVELGTVSGVEIAIAEAEQISSDSKIYPQVSALIEDWNQQKEDIAYLASARNLARTGDIGDLKAAIARAELVRSGNTLYGDAQREINSWRREIQVIEDRPIIDQGKMLARNNTVQGWQSAIGQVRQISSNRALYSEARELIRQWQTNIETSEDRPVLQNAISLGNRSQYQEAINVASQIGRGRALYPEAQAKIRSWRIEINAKQNLDTAYRIARRDDEQSLLRAINLARRVPQSSSISFQSRQAINLWSEQMLDIAQRMADTYSLSAIEKAISIAQMIPRGNSAHTRAQNRIRIWRQELYPSLNIDTPLQETNFTN